MIGGFLKSQHTLLNLSGSTAEIGTLQTGSSIVGISINGNPYTENNDIPLNWTGSFVNVSNNPDFSFLQLNENEVIKDVGPIGTRLFKTVYTLETPSGSLSTCEDEYIMVAQKVTNMPVYDWEDGGGAYSDGYHVYFEQLDGIEWGNEDDSLNPITGNHIVLEDGTGKLLTKHKYIQIKEYANSEDSSI